MQPSMVNWCGCFGDERSSAALHLDSSCRELLDAGATLLIVTRLTTTSAAFPLTSDGVHHIMACWELMLQSFGAEQIGHTAWPTNKFAHACVEVKHISIPFSCIPSRNKAEIGATSVASLKYSAFMQLTMVHCCGGFGDEQCWVVPWTTNEDFVCITSHARSTAATSFTCAVTSDGVHRIMACWVLMLQSVGA